MVGQPHPCQQKATQHIQLKVDNGSESSGVRTQFLKRMVEFADTTGKSIHLLYYPPYHSKYNPIERCWGILEQHWNGAKLVNVKTMLAWARSMTWKGLHPIVHLNQKVYQKVSPHKNSDASDREKIRTESTFA